MPGSVTHHEELREVQRERKHEKRGRSRKRLAAGGRWTQTHVEERVSPLVPGFDSSRSLLFLLRFAAAPCPFLTSSPSLLQIFADGDFHHFVDGLDETRSNWMRYVNPAHSAAEQNLAACQNGMEVYFYTVKPVPAGAELLVWYCHDFARRLHYPPSGELMMQKLSKSGRAT